MLLSIRVLSLDQFLAKETFAISPISVLYLFNSTEGLLHVDFLLNFIQVIAFVPVSSDQ